MLHLDDRARWDSLHHARGPASDVPALLEGLASETEQHLDSLRAALLHQSMVYPATYAAVPYVVAIAESKPPHEQVALLDFVATVALHAPKSAPPPPELYASYNAALSRASDQILAALARRPSDEHDALSLLRGFATVKSCTTAAHALTALVEDRLAMSCPACSARLSVRNDGEVLSVTVADPLHPPTPVEAWSEATAALDGPTRDFSEDSSASWLAALAVTAGHRRLATLVCQLYGTAQCPSCAHRFELLGAARG